MSTTLPFLAEMDWHQLWYLISRPDNVPIVLLLILCPFYVWLAFREAKKNDNLIARLEASGQEASAGEKAEDVLSIAGK